MQNKSNFQFNFETLRSFSTRIMILVLLLNLSACQTAAHSASPTSTIENLSAVETSLPPATPTSVPPTATSIPPTPTPSDETLATPLICSPLEGYTLTQLKDSIGNPFSPPPAGSDDAHQGIDIAELIGNSQVAIEGKPVNVVLSGRVAAVINDRFPYGNAVLIETPFESLPDSLLGELLIPESNSEWFPPTSLTCPQLVELPSWSENTDRSLYLMYAHLKDPGSLSVGETVSCGQMINSIGSTGNAMNPHLHLELRIGPSNATFSGMAHYDASATQEEMSAYCLWRVSNIFQLLNPMILLEALPE